MENELRLLREAAEKMIIRKDGFTKQASVLSSLFDPTTLQHAWDTAAPYAKGAGLFALGEKAYRGLQRFGNKQGPSLLQSNLKLGQEGKRMNYYLEDGIQNYLGKRSIAPAEFGARIGQRAHEEGWDDAQTLQHIRSLAAEERVKEQVARRQSELEGRLDKFKPSPLLPAMEGVLAGKGDNLVSKVVRKTAVPADAPRKLRHDVAQIATTLPAGPLWDSRIVARPILREQSPMLTNAQTTVAGTQALFNHHVTNRLPQAIQRRMYGAQQKVNDGVDWLVNDYID